MFDYRRLNKLTYLTWRTTTPFGKSLGWSRLTLSLADLWRAISHPDLSLQTFQNAHNKIIGIKNWLGNCQWPWPFVIIITQESSIASHQSSDIITTITIMSYNTTWTHRKSIMKPTIKNDSVLNSMAGFCSKPLGKVCILDAGPLSLEVPLALKGAPGTKSWTMRWKTWESAHVKHPSPESEYHPKCEVWYPS